jgi:hypothetical protein
MKNKPALSILVNRVYHIAGVPYFEKMISIKDSRLEPFDINGLEVDIITIINKYILITISIISNALLYVYLYSFFFSNS